jgi:hypothetical protein
MNTKLQKSLLAGIVGTVLMTVFMMIAPMLGMPEMDSAQMLSEMLGMSIAIGWVAHFAIGICFALFYSYVCFMKYKINNDWIKGIVFGVIVFIVAQLLMALMSQVFTMPAVDAEMSAIIIASLIGHIIYGVAVVKVVGDSYRTK